METLFPKALVQNTKYYIGLLINSITLKCQFADAHLGKGHMIPEPKAAKFKYLVL